jgi:hypothetical protein
MSYALPSVKGHIRITPAGKSDLWVNKVLWVNGMVKTVKLEIDGRISVGDQSPETIDPIQRLGDRVALAEGYCLRSFFKMAEIYPLLQRLSAFFPGELKRYHEIMVEKTDYLAATAINFCKTAEMIGFPDHPRLEIYTSLRNASQEGAISEIREIGLPGLLDVPLTLGRLRHIVFGDKVDMLEFETTYTFFEFIDGIAWELSFLTTPTECQIRR